MRQAQSRPASIECADHDDSSGCIESMGVGDTYVCSTCRKKKEEEMEGGLTRLYLSRSLNFP
jgi:hypothetical protein